MTKVYCEAKSCVYNKMGVCTRDSIGISAEIGCELAYEEDTPIDE